MTRSTKAPKASVSPRRLALLGALLLLGACVNEGDSRFKTTASPGKPLSSGDAVPAEGDNGSGVGNGNGVGVGDGDTAGTTPANSRSLEQCTAEKKAWRAVVNSGAAPSDCVETLVDWCCTEQEIAARFPTMAATLGAKFQTVIDEQKHVLYHCSFDSAAKKYTFHTAKISPSGKLSYRYVFVKDVSPVDTGSATNNCTQVTTEQLNVSEEIVIEEPDDAALTFADVQPIVEAKCGGAACHDDGGPLSTAAEFVNSESRFKASGTNRIDDGSMPPSGSPAMTADEKAKLLRFLSE